MEPEWNAGYDQREMSSLCVCLVSEESVFNPTEMWRAAHTTRAVLYIAVTHTIYTHIESSVIHVTTLVCDDWMLVMSDREDERGVRGEDERGVRGEGVEVVKGEEEVRWGRRRRRKKKTRMRRVAEVVPVSP